MQIPSPMKMIAATAALGLFWYGSGIAQDREPVRIGALTSLSGPYQAYGDEIRDGILAAIDEANANGGVDGRKVEVEFADTAGNPDTGRSEAGKLALKNHKLLLGTVSSAVSLAVSGQTRRMDTLFVATLSKTNLLTGKDCNARTFRTYQSDAMDIALIEPWLAEQPEEKWIVLAADYAWGHDSSEGFVAAAENVGKTTLPSIFAPFGSTDFASYITQLKESDAQGIWVANSGGDFINFWKQAKQFGLTEDKRIIAASGVNASVIATLGDVSRGISGIVNYSSTLDTPENQAFIKAWRETHDKDPAFTTVQGYIGTRAILQAVEKAKSTDPEAVAAALEDLVVDTGTFGEAKMRAADHQLVLPNYIGHVGEAEDGSLKPIIDESFEPEQYMPPPSEECKLH